MRCAFADRCGPSGWCCCSSASPVYALRPRNREHFDDAARIPFTRRGPEDSRCRPRSNKRSRHRRRDHRPRVGRHQGAEHAAAALVALTSSTPRSSGRSAIGSSIRPGQLVTATPAACSAIRARASCEQAWRQPPARAQKAWLAPHRQASLEQIEAGSRTARLRHGRRPAAFADNCAPCHGAGGAGGQGYPDAGRRRLALGRQARRTSSTTMRTASARRPMPTRASRRCRPSARPAADARSRSTTSPSTCCRFSGARPTRRPPSAARRSSRRIARPATARTARACRSSARPA